MKIDRTIWKTVREGCEIFDCSDFTLRSLRRGAKAKVKKDGRTVYFNVQDVIEYIKNNELKHSWDLDAPEKSRAKAQTVDTNIGDDNRDYVRDDVSTEIPKGKEQGGQIILTNREIGMIQEQMQLLKDTIEDKDHQIVLIRNDREALEASHKQEIERIINTNDSIIDGLRDEIEKEEEKAKKFEKESLRKFWISGIMAVVLTSVIVVSVLLIQNFYLENKSITEKMEISEKAGGGLKTELIQAKADLASANTNNKLLSGQVTKASKDYATNIKDFTTKLLEANDKIYDLENKLKTEQQQKKIYQDLYENYQLKIQVDPNKVEEKTDNAGSVGQGGPKEGEQIEQPTSLVELAEKIQN